MILHVTCSENTRHRSRGCVPFQPGLRDDVAVHHIELARENFCVRLVTDGDKATVQSQFTRCAIGGGFEANAGDATFVAEYLVECMIPEDGDLTLFFLGK